MIVKLKTIAEDNGGRKEAIRNGFQCYCKTHSSPLVLCEFVLPLNKTLEIDQTYSNVNVNVGEQPEDRFTKGARVYFYENNKMIVEGFIER